MRRYILGRCFQALFCLLIVSFIVFMVTRLSGNPADLLLGEFATIEDRALLEESLGLDRPVSIQYWLFLRHAVMGDFGKSIRAQRPALDLVLERLPASLQLGGFAILMCVAIALPIGIYAAVRRGSWFDAISRGFAVLGQSTPSFWLGIMLIYVFAVWLKILPSGGRGGVEHLILPAITLGWYVAAGIMRITRSSMLDVLGSEYVKLARLKGMPERAVIWKHAFKNAALSVLTFSVLLFVYILAGSVITETVFAWPGVSRLAIDAIRWRDYPVVQTVVLLLSTMYVTANLLVDLLYSYLNPKIRFQK